MPWRRRPQQRSQPGRVGSSSLGAGCRLRRSRRTMMNGSLLHRRVIGYPLFAFGFLPLLVVVLVAGCAQTPPPADKKPAEVIVTMPVSGEVTDYQDFTGRLDALKTVEIRARVTGFVMSAPFKEGDLVHEGDLLFAIDPRTYQANLNQAAANLKLAEADRNLQEKNVSRARQMITSHSIAREDY